jgi:acetyl esterase/lipase
MDKPVKGMKMPGVSPEILKKISHIERDIAYAEQSESQKFDIYWPEADKFKGPYPVIVYFHGGAFLFGDKADQALEPMLRGVFQGFVVVSAEYRKSGEARFPALMYDAKAVIRFLRAHAKAYQIDPHKIAVWGPSSGGWMVAMLGVTEGNEAFEDLSMGNAAYSSAVNAVIDWCGPCGDFSKMDEEMEKSGAGHADHNEARSPESMILGSQITNIKELCRLACPITYVTPSCKVPFLILHGGADQIVPVEQSIDFAAALNKANPGLATLKIAPGMKHHGDPWYHEEWVSTMCFEFLKKAFAL